MPVFPNFGETPGVNFHCTSDFATLTQFFSMKTKSLFLASFLSLFLSAACFAEILPVDGEFAELTADGLPAKWVLHPWEGFQPLPDMTVQVGADDGHNVVSFRKIASENGMGFRNAQRLPGRCGDQVRVNTLAETRMRVLCDACAAKAYPEAFNITAQV